MTDRSTPVSSRRVAAYALTGLAAFVGFSFVFADLGMAAPLDLARDPMAALGGSSAVFLLLAAVFSGLTVLNLAFFGHVIRNSARPNRVRTPKSRSAPVSY